MDENFVCWHCGEPLQEVAKPFPRLEKCQSCEADLHVCRMCKEYNSKVNGYCDHDMAEPARETELANFCQYFTLQKNAYTSGSYDKAKAAAEQLNALFGESGDKAGSALQQKNDALESFKELFKDEADTTKSRKD